MKYLILLVWITLLLSCGDECENGVRYYRNKQINLILRKKPNQGRSYTLNGINPITQGDEEFYDSGGGWGIYYKKYLEIGDTIYKKEGELKIYVHKKDTILIFPFKCHGKSYN
jgi:hypothetical protein